MSNGAFFIIRCSQSLPAISLTVSFSHNFDQHRRNKATTASQIRPRSATLLLALLLTGRMSATSACNGLTLAGHACMCQHAVHSPRPVTRPRSHLRLRDLHQHKAAQSRRQRAPALKKVLKAVKCLRLRLDLNNNLSQQLSMYIGPPGLGRRMDANN